ncbi:MAG: UPF0058 family protein [Methanobrevibacter sp.]|jgi:hypothetical protein|nr:UPF0058 family protein [Methanobrevibacter sp.]
MNKDEIILLHQFLLYILKHLEDDDKMQETCSEYISLNIKPQYIHKTKIEHKHAIFLLSTIISQIIVDRDYDSIPTDIANSMNEIAKRLKNEINRETDRF